MFDFGEALAYMKADFKVTNSRGNIYYIENDKIYCIPKAQYPKGKREVVKFYTDAILANDWELLDKSDIETKS